MSLSSIPQNDQGFRNQTSLLFSGLLAVALISLGIRLYYLQVYKGDYHLKLSDQNSMRLNILQAPRGLILAREGEVLARNRPSFQIALIPTELENPDTLVNNLMRIRDTSGTPFFDSAQIRFSIERGKWRRFQPQVILEDAPASVVALVEEHQLDLPGVTVEVEARRAYPFGNKAAHVLGYMDEITEEELAGFMEKSRSSSDSLQYRKGERIGRMGLEKVYENHFSGRDGFQYVRVNALGKELEVLEEMPNIEPQHGHNIVTSLDMDLQLVAEENLPDSVKGAVVALDPRNGEVLVMVSSPRIDPNIFSLSKSTRSQKWAEIALDSRMPLNNRATVGGYQPASTFKAIVSLAGFKHGVQPHLKMPVPCRGGYRFGSRVWKCWKHSGHGSMDFYGAFRQSCNVYYYQLGLDVGIDAVNKVAKTFGFSIPTGIDLDAERVGDLVDSASYNRRHRKRGWVWTRGLILNLSIGQGQIATPLQLADYAAGLANGDLIYKPHLVKEIRSSDGKLIKKIKPEVLSEVDLTPSQHAAILKAMQAVVEPGGTGGRARVPDVIVGGKTGSAQNPHGDLTHALFIGAAPLYSPEIVIAVVLENMGGGGYNAAPIAGKIFNAYFDRKKNGKKQPNT